MEDLIIQYPSLYHMAELGSWPSIERFGLKSTTALLDFFEIKGDQRLAIESKRRKESVVITHPKYGSAVIRDQKPLNEANLERLLDGMSLVDYYMLLNRKTFFWVRKERLETLLGATAYRNRSHIVLAVETRGIVTAHAEQITLSPINSGSTVFGNGRRGVQTFKSIDDYPYDDRKKARKEPLVELAVDYSVDDIARFTLKVEEWKGPSMLKIIWSR